MDRGAEEEERGEGGGKPADQRLPATLSTTWTVGLILLVDTVFR